jgi:glycosyltransferase involved in cell wall biosynthesis
MPLISVVVPVYNGEKTIRETIESVLNQTFKDLELIIINDGSKDATLEIVSEIQDPRIQVFSYPNAGLSASRNRGISQATGEYISFIDADDLWTPDKLENQLKALQSNPQAALAYSWTNFIDEAGNFLRRGGYISVTSNPLATLLLVNFVENGSNPLIRTHVFKEVGGFDELLRSAEDLDMWLRLAVRYDFVAVPKPQVLYRMSANSMSSNKNIVTHEKSIVQVLERAFNQAPASVQHLKRVSFANWYKYFIFKVLDGEPTQLQGLLALRYLLTVLKNDPMLVQKPVFRTVVLKIAIALFLPPTISRRLPNKIKRLSDISLIFQSMQKTPFMESI